MAIAPRKGKTEFVVRERVCSGASAAVEERRERVVGGGGLDLEGQVHIDIRFHNDLKGDQPRTGE